MVACAQPCTLYVQGKLRNTRDKREVIMRERQLLSERIENLKQSITAEFEARQAQKLVKNLNFWREKEVGDYGQCKGGRVESCANIL